VRGLYALADDDPRSGRDPVDVARAALAGGARVVQLRAKHASDRQAIAWAEAIRDLCRVTGALLVVNDRFDLALAAGADGVHLGQDDLPPARLPAAARARLLVGRSTHTQAQLEAARAEPIDYVAFGPLFGTTSKDSAFSARGLEALAEAARRTAPLPCVAIGGIDAARAPAAIRAGAAAVAVISAIAAAPDMQAAARELAQAVEQARVAAPVATTRR
jgi:thiamine-phosphate pyrophosphorylase